MQWQIEWLKRVTYLLLKVALREDLHDYHIGLHLLYHARVHDLYQHVHVYRFHDCDRVLHEHGFHAHVNFHVDAFAKPFSRIMV